MPFFENFFNKDKHLLRNGIGSPGETARTITTWYKNFKKESPFKTKEELFEDVYEFRSMILEQMGTTDSLYNDFSGNEITDYCCQDMALFVFICLALDTYQFRVGLRGPQDVIILVLDIIKEEIKKIDASLISLSDSNYKNKALNFRTKII